MNTRTNIIKTRPGALGVAVLAAVFVGASAPVLHAQADSGTNNSGTNNNSTNNNSTNYSSTNYSSTNSGDQVDLYPGTVIPVKLNTELSSNKSQEGDTFTAAVDDSKEAYNSIMQGATISGVVRHVTPQAGDTPGTLDLAFTRLRLSDGRTVSITGSPASLDSKNLTTGAGGVLVAKNSSKDNRLTYAGYGAGAGLLVSLLTGDKKIKIEDILLGGLAGYGAGSVLKSPQQVHDVDLQPGTAIGVRLDSRTRYYHKVPKAVVNTAVKRTKTPVNKTPVKGMHRVRHAHTYYTYSN